MGPAGSAPPSTETPDPVIVNKIRIAYTPDSDDAFAFYAWESGRLSVRDVEPEFHRAHIAELNRAAGDGEFDVVAVSSAFYPRIAEAYAVLTVGNSICRNCGPVLVAREPLTLAELRGAIVAVGGHPTTGSALCAMFAPGVRFRDYPFERIIGAVQSGEVDAGVMIHEEILAYRAAGLNLVGDLGALWCERTGLPLPVGLNVIRKSLGEAQMRRVATGCERSLQWALAHPQQALRHARGFGRGLAVEHLSMFADSDSVRLPEDARRGVERMAVVVAELGLGPPIESPVRFVEGELDLSSATR